MDQLYALLAITIGALYFLLFVGLAYGLLVVAANLVTRVATGRWFPWISARTVVPFIALAILCFVAAYVALTKIVVH